MAKKKNKNQIDSNYQRKLHEQRAAQEVEVFEDQTAEVTADTIEVDAEVTAINEPATISEGVVLSKKQIREQEKEAKKAIKAKAAEDRERQLKKQEKNKKERKSLWKRLKETMSEVKKVSWPTFKKVLTSTGVVLAVVIFFTIILFAFDTGLGELYNLFIKAITGGS